MSNHIHRILRSWHIVSPGQVSYVTAVSESAITFFNAGTLNASDKWTAYGELRGVMCRRSSGAYGQKLPFIITKAVGFDPVLVKGTLADSLASYLTAYQFIDVETVTSYFNIKYRGPDNGESSVINLTLDLTFVGNSISVA